MPWASPMCATSRPTWSTCRAGSPGLGRARASSSWPTRSLRPASTSADRQAEHLAGSDHRLVEAVDGPGMMIGGNRQMQSIARSQTCLVAAQISPGHVIVAPVWKPHDKGLSDDLLEERVDGASLIG